MVGKSLTLAVVPVESGDTRTWTSCALIATVVSNPAIMILQMLVSIRLPDFAIPVIHARILL